MAHRPSASVARTPSPPPALAESAISPTAPLNENGSDPSRPEAGNEPLFLNRDLQWLRFNHRVLHQARDTRMPLLERVRFLSIFSSNLDEFFMKRVGGLRRQVDAGVPLVAHEGVSPARLLGEIRRHTIPMTREKSLCYRKELLPALRARGIELLHYAQATDDERTQVDAWYRRDVFPILTPLAVDPGHRFPFISNLSVSLGVMLRRPGEEEHMFARVKVPEAVPQWYQVRGTSRFILLRDIIENNLGDLFAGMQILNVLPFRVTRNADVQDDHEDAEDLLEQIQAQLRDRRFAPVVRLQIGRRPPRELLQFLTEEMEIRPDDIYETHGLLNYRGLSEIADIDRPELRFAPWVPVVPQRLSDPEKDIFTVIREGDVLLHHPYESFEDSVERFIDDAATDPSVLCIKQALYRTSGDSAFVHSLIRAAEAGKQVAVLVELRARFDEARNIAWARTLEDAGVHVAYGVVGLKTHTKIALVVRRESPGIRCYAHLSTGNYNARTARQYDDVGILTADPAICDDVVDLFNFMTGRSLKNVYQRLLVAPHAMKRQFIELIEREIGHQQAGRRGRLIAKMNQLQDREVIEALYRASRAGVEIDLVVRGFCTLRPVTPGLSERIRVTSIIGRFLEHSRIFWFGNGEPDPLDGDFFIGSADWMYRNLHARVEAACPIAGLSLRARLWQVLETCLSDRRQAWDMCSDGSYTIRQPAEIDPGHSASLGTHQRLMRLALEGRQGAEGQDPGSPGAL